MFAGIPCVSSVYGVHMTEDLSEVSTYELIRELNTRDYAVRILDAEPEEPEEPEETDLDRWLAVWNRVEAAQNSGRLDHLIRAVAQLLTLIEPPSVKVARLLTGSDAEASSRT